MKELLDLIEEHPYHILESVKMTYSDTTVLLYKLPAKHYNISFDPFNTAWDKRNWVIVTRPHLLDFCNKEGIDILSLQTMLSHKTYDRILHHRMEIERITEVLTDKVVKACDAEMEAFKAAFITTVQKALRPGLTLVD
jgi:hypothetical protein